MNYQYLGVDFGDSYVGLSVSNGLIPKVLPVFKYPKCDYEKLKIFLKKKIDEFKISRVIIGIPFDERSSSKIKRIFYSVIFKEDFLRNKIVWVNEDDSTVEALKFKSRKRMREDSISASIILERFLLKKKWDVYMNDVDITKKITKSDFDFLKKKVDELEKSRQEKIEKIKFVDGDISENADWKVLTQNSETISMEIEKKRKAMSEIIEIIPDEKINTESVDMGSKVFYEIIGEKGNIIHEVIISHEITTDPFRNKISCKSPLGLSLKGGKVNDTVDVINSGYSVRILKIK